MFVSDEGTTLKTLDFAFYIGSTPTFYISRFVSQPTEKTKFVPLSAMDNLLENSTYPLQITQ